MSRNILSDYLAEIARISATRAGTGGPPSGNIQDEFTAKLSNEPMTLSMALMMSSAS